MLHHLALKIDQATSHFLVPNIQGLRRLLPESYLKQYSSNLKIQFEKSLQPFPFLKLREGNDRDGLLNFSQFSCSAINCKKLASSLPILLLAL